MINWNRLLPARFDPSKNETFGTIVEPFRHDRIGQIGLVLLAGCAGAGGGGPCDRLCCPQALPIGAEGGSGVPDATKEIRYRQARMETRWM